MIFDAKDVDDLVCSGTDWADLKVVKAQLVGNPAVTKQGRTWAELAQKTGLPADQLEASIVRYNGLVRDCDDIDFRRFGKHGDDPILMDFKPQPPIPRVLDTPPYYAMQLFPLTRKNMGGLKIDVNCRVLGADDKPISGLFAVGEASGLGGVNGKAGLEGTFLGPSLLQGRRAGRFIATGSADMGPAELSAAVGPVPAVISRPENTASSAACKICHTLPIAFFSSRPGFWHFGKVHQKAAERNYDCRKCHGEVELLRPSRHRIDGMIQTTNCSLCHLPVP
jgi:succinate dehydrogenase/fumarate reductase flavoprotein subunit